MFFLRGAFPPGPIPFLEGRSKEPFRPEFPVFGLSLDGPERLAGSTFFLICLIYLD